MNKIPKLAKGSILQGSLYLERETGPELIWPQRSKKGDEGGPMKFRRKEAIPLPYNRQIYIYAHCINYALLSTAQQEVIDQLCIEVGGYHYQALLEHVTKGTGITELSSRYPGLSSCGKNFRPLVQLFYLQMDKIL